jgi:hypothetical protein
MEKITINVEPVGEEDKISFLHFKLLGAAIFSDKLPTNERRGGTCNMCVLTHTHPPPTHTHTHKHKTTLLFYNSEVSVN